MKPFLLILGLLTGCLPLCAQSLVANIDQSNAGSSPQLLQSDGRYAVFTAADPAYDRQLYILEGAAGTPVPLLDPATREPVMNPYGLALLEGSVYYYTHGERSTTYYRAELESGTITELASLPSPGANGGEAYFTRLGSRTVFVHITENYGRELYAVEDGGGAVLLTTLPDDAYLNGLAVVGNRILMAFNYWPSDPVLFGLTDGTPGGTIIRYLEDGTRYLGPPVPYDGSFIVQRNTDSTSTLVYYDTLTANLTPLADRITGLPAGNLTSLTGAEGYVYFARRQLESVELWRIDSATGMASPVTGLNPDRDSVSLSALQPFDSLVFYRLYDRRSGRVSLWRTDGTAAGTVQLLDGIASRSVNGFSLGEVVATDDGYYFLADRPATGTELWRTDGTPAGTGLVRDLYPGPDDSELSQLTAMGDDLLFVGTGPDYGSEVYRTDGTAGGTVVVADLNTAEVGSNPNRFFTFNDTLFFSARTGCTGFELFKSGGTAGTTSLLGDLVPGREDGQFSPVVGIGDRFYFGLNGPFPDSDTLYTSDGSSAGTLPVNIAGLPAVSPIVLSAPGVLGDRLLVNGFFAGQGQSLYSLDPRTGEAELLRVFSAWGSNSSGIFFSPFQDSLLLFQQATDEFGAELWRTNGTPEGTYMIKDILPRDEPGNTFYHIGELTVIGDLAYFSANDGFSQRAYRTDGTAEGTYALQGAGSLDAIRNFTAYAGRVYFTARRFGSYGFYSTAGEAYDVAPSPIGDGTEFLYLSDLTVLGERLVFTGHTAAMGTELWAAADAASPAVSLGDLYAGPDHSYPRSLFAVDSSLLLFSAEVPEVGRELWSTDGTPAGTLLVADINPGTASSDPENFYAYGDFVYFAANDGVVGTELWKYSPDDLDNDGYVGADDTDETDPLVNAGTNGDPNLVGVSCAAPGDTSTAIAALPDLLIEVYPNPTAERINVRVPEGRGLRAELYARDGRLVLTAAGIYTEHVLPVGHLPAGSYLLRLSDPASGRAGHHWVTVRK